MKQSIGCMLRRNFLWSCALAPAGFLKAQQGAPAIVPGRPQPVPIAPGELTQWRVV